MNFSWQRGLPVPVCIALGSIKLSGARRAIWGMLASAVFIYLSRQATACMAQHMSTSQQEMLFVPPAMACL